MTLTLEHKKIIAAVTLVAALGFVLVDTYVDGSNRSRLPEIPVLRGAKNVQRSVNIGASGTPIDPLEVVSFVIDGESQQVEQYVRGAMQQKGWRQDRCCRDHYTHLNRDPDLVGSYMADVSVVGGGSATYVTIQVTHGKVACDCLEAPVEAP
ncbi:MAG TPA: hypothetical protein VF914_08345 [Chloroflexia bacterium]|jgi:hypothetical protein